MTQAGFFRSDRELLSELFPFHLILDREIRVKSVGRSIKKLIGKVDESVPLAEFATLARPEQEIDATTVAGLTGNLAFVRLVGPDVVIRGQFCLLNDEYLFVGSPMSNDTAELMKTGLETSDFAPFDPTVENLYVQQAHQAQFSNLEQTLAQLEKVVSDHERIATTEQQLAYDLSSAGDVLLRVSETGEIIDCRTTNEDFLPLNSHLLIGRRVNNEMPFVTDKLFSAIKKLKAGEPAVSIDYEYETVKGTIYFEARVAFAFDKSVVLLARDVSEKKEYENKLRFQAEHDALTGLPNRRAFMKKVRHGLMDEYSTALIMLDLDGFKEVNDFHGHHVGDLVLIEVAERLRNLLKNDMVAARVGGDEFGILYRVMLRRSDYAIADIDRVEAQLEQFCCRVSAVIMNPIKVGDLRICLHASFGIATQHETNTDTPEVLLRHADLAINTAKQPENLNKAVFFTRGMQKEYFEHRQLMEDLKNAVVNNQLFPYYQPIVDIETNEVVTIEALARWVHPTRGFIPPSKFIPIAEESSQICKIGEMMLFAACEQTHLLNQSFGPLTTSVNLSAVQIQSSDIVKTVESALERSKLSPERLVLEVTESLLLKDLNQSTELLQSLRRLGCKIALDDFGIGYSSLAYLEKLPIDILKLDRMFVSKLNDNSAKQKAIVKAIVDLGHALGLKIVCEGIEEIEQQNVVQGFGCRFIQGFLHSKPLPIHELINYLSREKGGSDNPTVSANQRQALPTERTSTPTVSNLQEPKPVTVTPVIPANNESNTSPSVALEYSPDGF